MWCSACVTTQQMLGRGKIEGEEEEEEEEEE